MIQRFPINKIKYYHKGFHITMHTKTFFIINTDLNAHIQRYLDYVINKLSDNWKQTDNLSPTCNLLIGYKRGADIARLQGEKQGISWIAINPTTIDSVTEKWGIEGLLIVTDGVQRETTKRIIYKDLNQSKAIITDFINRLL